MINKKFAITILSLIFCLSLFASCQNTNENNRDYFAKDGATDYVVVVNRENYVYAEKFVENFKQKTGILLGLKYDDTIEEETEIIFGRTDRLLPEEEVRTRYVGYDIVVREKKILISATDSEQLANASQRLCNGLNEIVDTDGKNMVLKKDAHVSGSTDTVMEELPFYTAKAGGAYDIGGGSKSVYIPNATAEDFSAYEALLESNGFKKYSENTIVNNKYAIYTSDKTTVNLTYIPNETKLLISAEAKGSLPSKAQEYKKVTETQLTQVKLIQETNMDGMSYLIRLADGRFVCIDGGYHEALGKQAERFYSLMLEQNEDRGKPVIALWILTHPHEDHIGMFTDFIARYSNEVIIEQIAYDFGSDESILNGDSSYLLKGNALGSLTKMYQNIEEYIPNVPVLKLHGGHKIHLADAVIEVIYTLSDMIPSTCADLQMNATSTIFTLTVEGQKTIFLADAMPIECSSLIQMYGNALKSDLMQLAHHGYNGAIKEIYEIINPKVGLWPSNPIAIPNNSTFDYNKWLIDNQTTQELLVSGYYQFTLKLPYSPSNNDLTNKFINKP